MYKRDVAVLILSSFAVYFALKDEGTFSFRKAWYFPIHGNDELLYQADILPPPVVIDMNGDGSMEVVTATHDFKIQVLKPRGAGKEGDGFAQAHVMAEASLLPKGVHLTAGRRAVALSAGFIDPPNLEMVRKPRKAVIVVVMADWHVTCYDHNLKILWSKDVHEDVPQHATIEEVGILISNHTVYTGDRGMVVIGGSMHLGADLMESDLNGAAGGIADEDVFEAELKEEEREALREKSLGDKGKLEGIGDAVTDSRGVDLTRHFSYYAYEGGSGYSRWKHEGTDFHRDLDSLKDELIPQQNYRLDAESLTSRHYGEVSCRDFRESVLHVLPHRWTRRSDTAMQLAHFAKHRSGKKGDKKQLGEKGKPKQTGTAQSKDAVSNVINKVANKAMSGGRESVQTVFDPVASLPANSLVAHLKEGIEAIHLYTGKPLCKLHLPEGGLHVDLNGDGVLDHVQVTGKEHAEVRSETGHHRIPQCWAYATSGVPPIEPLFNGSVCRRSFSGVWSDRVDSGPASMQVQVGPPVMLPIPTPSGHYRFKYGQRGYAVFLTCTGHVTAFGAHGDKKWQVLTPAKWQPALRRPEKFTHFVPTVESLALRTHSLPTTILVGGLKHAVILSEHGHTLVTLPYPAQPVAPLKIVDFNGDGLNDIILMGRDEIYGYEQIRHPGGVPFSMLLLCLIIAMGVIYVTQHTGVAAGKKLKRSTERMD